MDTSHESSATPARRPLAWAALALAVVLLTYTCGSGLWALFPGPDVHVETGEVVVFEGFVLLQVAALVYASWSLVRFLRRRPVRWGLTAVAYGLGVVLTPWVWLLAVRDFSGG